MKYPACLCVIFAVGLIGGGCARAVVKQAPYRLTILVSGNLTVTELAKMANLVSELRQRERVLWFGTGRLIFDQQFEFEKQAEMEVTLLNRAGVDLQIFNPEWLKLGTCSAKELIDRARFFVLAGNLEDTAGLSIAHNWFVKKVDDLVIGVTALLTDSGSVYYRLRGVNYLSPSYAARRVLGILKNRGGFNIVLLPPGGWFEIPDYDLVASTVPDSITVYKLAFVGQRLIEMNGGRMALENVKPLPVVQAVSDSIFKTRATAANETLILTRVKILPEDLSKILLDGILKLGFIDGFIYDRGTIVQDTILPGPVTRSKLEGILPEPGRLVIFNINGTELRRLLSLPDVKVILAPKLANRISNQKLYRLGMTFDLLKREPDYLKVTEFELSELRLVDYLADLLQSRGKR